jgi:hypothetical protein
LKLLRENAATFRRFPLSAFPWWDGGPNPRHQN